jgi:5-hydroxyisourate hydrolase
MATVSSHILDTVSGVSAMGIQVQLFRISGDQRKLLFDVRASDEGRIIESIELSASDTKCEYELVFHGAAYFSTQPCPADSNSCMKVVVLRFSMSDPDKRYHMPVMLSPHSYSVWWSS